MKRIINILFTAIVISSAVSCVKQLDKENTVDSTNKDSVEGLVQITFDANVDQQTQQAQPAQSSQITRTTYESGRTVAWEADDKVSVFSVGGNTPAKTEYSISELSDDRKSAKFTGLADETATHYYAVYPHSEATAFSNEEITVSIPSVQTAFANGFASGSNVCVARAEAGTKAFAFKNISSLICFSFNTEADALNTKSVKIRARKSEDGDEFVEYLSLTGEVKVTYNEGQLYKVSEGTADYVVVNAPAKGFEYGKTYFVPVAPVGDVNGFEVTFTDKNDTPFVMRNDNAVTLDRNKLFNLSKVPDPYLPEEFTITLDFKAGWPFNSLPVAEDEQVISGEKYIYSYAYGVGTNVRDIEFIISKGNLANDKSYTYVDKEYLLFNGDDNNSTAMISLPFVRGRYLNKLEALYTNNDTKRFVVQQGDAPNGSPNVWITDNNPAIFSFPNNTVPCIYGQAYGLRMRHGNVQLQEVAITYTKTKPE